MFPHDYVRETIGRRSEVRVQTADGRRSAGASADVVDVGGGAASRQEPTRRPDSTSSSPGRPDGQPMTRSVTPGGGHQRPQGRRAMQWSAANGWGARFPLCTARSNQHFPCLNSLARLRAVAAGSRICYAPCQKESLARVEGVEAVEGERSMVNCEGSTLDSSGDRDSSTLRPLVTLRPL